MTRTIAALAAVLLLTAASGARAADPPVSDKTQVFCRDNTGTPVLQTYANWGAVMRRYADRFHFDMTVTVDPGQPMKVTFSNAPESPYSITYMVEPYRDSAGRSGIVLDSLHIFLENADRDVDGVGMCYFAEYGK